MGVFVYTLKYLYKSQSWQGFSRSSWRASVFFKRGTVFKPWDPIKERPQPAWIESQIFLPEVTHCLSQPLLMSKSRPKEASRTPSYRLGGIRTYPCRYRGCDPHRCRSCTPVLYGGRTAVPRGSLGWVALRTPCSSRNCRGPNWSQGGRTGAPRGTRTLPDSQQSPARGRKSFHFTRSDGPTRPQEKKAWLMLLRSQKFLSVCGLNIGMNSQHCREPHRGICNPLSPSAWHSVSLWGMKGMFSDSHPSTSPLLHFFCSQTSLCTYTEKQTQAQATQNNFQVVLQLQGRLSVKISQRDTFTQDRQLLVWIVHWF